MRRSVVWSLLSALCLAACTATGSSAPSPLASPAATDAGTTTTSSSTLGLGGEPVRLVTLGDGYTFGAGTSAPLRDSWPSQLVEALKRKDINVRLWNLAEQSHTSAYVVEEQLGQVASFDPDLVTLQVGVNDIVSGDTSDYRRHVETILDEVLRILPPERIFAITMPDHTLTGWGRSFGSVDEERAAIVALNATLTEVAAERGIGVIDISPVNELVATDPGLVVEDGPYGSPKQYAGWVEIIGPRILAAIEGREP